VADRKRDDTADLVAIWRLQATYADTVTRRAWSELAGLFLPAATIEVDTVTATTRRFVGPQDLAGFISGALERFDHFQFVILNTVVDVDSAESARGRVFMCEIRHDPAADEWSTAYGLYQDSYERMDGTWFFSDRRYRSVARTGANAGIFGMPPDLPPLSR
jgi:hypothetical protein